MVLGAALGRLALVVAGERGTHCATRPGQGHCPILMARWGSNISCLLEFPLILEYRFPFFMFWGSSSVLPFGNGEYLGVFEKIKKTSPPLFKRLSWSKTIANTAFPGREKKTLYKPVQTLLIINYQFPKHFCPRGSYCGASGIEGLEITTRKRSKDLDKPWNKIGSIFTINKAEEKVFKKSLYTSNYC